MRPHNREEVFRGPGVLILSYFNLTVVGVSFISNQRWQEIAEHLGIMKNNF